jgi:hypothetical protein
MNDLPTESIAPDVMPLGMAREVIYVASPVATYDTPRYDLMIAHAQRAFPDAKVLLARGLYRDRAHWLAIWPAHLAQLRALVYFADMDGSIGNGVFKEIADAQAQGIPVHYLSDDGVLILSERVALDLIDGGLSWRRYARVRLVNVVEASVAGESQGALQ